MASIEAHTPAAARRLDVADLAGALALSASANWNQNDADWRTMLALGEAWGIDASAADGRRQLAASTVILPYGLFAWVSMVLVLPEFRRRGYATRLLHQALATLAQRGVTAVLDATTRHRGASLVETAIDLPIVLPPSVAGLALLLVGGGWHPLVHAHGCSALTVAMKAPSTPRIVDR